jgi:cell division protein FtsQ
MQPNGTDGPSTDTTAEDPEEMATDSAGGQPTEAEPVVESASEPEPAPQDVEGPRRRARRERAERRAAQARAEAIELARWEAKRRVRGRPADEPKTVPRGAIRGLKVLGVSGLVSVFLVGLGLILYFTPVMSARNVDVIGIEVVTRDEVIDVAEVQLGTPLLQINTGEVADRVATIRRVAGTRVQRQYPSTLRIIVVERVAVVVKEFPDGPHEFDKDGVDFATEPSPPTVPYLDVDDPGPDDPATRAALQVMTALAPEVADQVGRVAAPSVASITLTLTDGRVVVWGGADRTAEKAAKLAALLTRPGHTYDVSSPDLPTVK